jgi:hypothetical protein
VSRQGKAKATYNNVPDTNVCWGESSMLAKRARVAPIT